MFAAISGSSVETWLRYGSIMMPLLVDYGYPRRFGVGVIATSGASGILVPPSIILVLYGVSTKTSIARVIHGRHVPGIVLALLLRRGDFVRRVRKTAIRACRRRPSASNSPPPPKACGGCC